MPQFTQWQQYGGWQFEKDNEDPAYKNVWYVNASEPGFTRPMSRMTERSEGRLQYLEPQEKRVVNLAVGALDTPEEIIALEEAISSRKKLEV